jgi:hypothetical protein
LVWILITTIMVVVGTGHCSDATAASLGHDGSSECQLLKAPLRSSKAQPEQVSQSIQLSSTAISTPEPTFNSTFVAQDFGSVRALGSSILASRRFSGTSPPVPLVG